MPRHVPWLQEMGKPCLAQGWPGSIWHRPALTACCLEPGSVGALIGCPKAEQLHAGLAGTHTAQGSEAEAQ